MPEGTRPKIIYEWSGAALSFCTTPCKLGLHVRFQEIHGLFDELSMKPKETVRKFCPG